LPDTTKKPVCPREVAHGYSDKYLLAEWVTLTGISSVFVVLEELGVDAALLAKLVDAVQNKSVTLRFTATETCDFDRHAKRKLDDKNKSTSEGFGYIWTSKVVHKIDEWFWKFAYSFELCLFVGQFDEASKIVLSKRNTGKYEIVTLTEDAPRPKSVVRDPIDVNLTWLLQRVKENEASFIIDRKVRQNVVHCVFLSIIRINRMLVVLLLVAIRKFPPRSSSLHVFTLSHPRQRKKRKQNFLFFYFLFKSGGAIFSGSDFPSLRVGRFGFEWPEFSRRVCSSCGFV
jgi:hypothetical protein